MVFTRKDGIFMGYVSFREGTKKKNLTLRCGVTTGETETVTFQLFPIHFFQKNMVSQKKTITLI